MQNRTATPAELRERADEVRRLAGGVWPHPAAEQLLAYATELEATAASMEQTGQDEMPVNPLD